MQQPAQQLTHAPLHKQMPIKGWTARCCMQQRQLTWLEVAADVSSVVGRDESAAADPLLLAASCLVSVRLA